MMKFLVIILLSFNASHVWSQQSKLEKIQKNIEEKQVELMLRGPVAAGGMFSGSHFLNQKIGELKKVDLNVFIEDDDLVGQMEQSKEVSAHHRKISHLTKASTGLKILGGATILNFIRELYSVATDQKDLGFFNDERKIESKILIKKRPEKKTSFSCEEI